MSSTVSSVRFPRVLAPDSCTFTIFIALSTGMFVNKDTKSNDTCVSDSKSCTYCNFSPGTWNFPHDVKSFLPKAIGFLLEPLKHYKL